MDGKLDALGGQLLEAMDGRRDAPTEVGGAITDVTSGLALQQAINRQRLARGDQALGFKIGFTNRTIWPLYGVYAPIWAPVWQSTVQDAPDATIDGRDRVDRLNRPRLEPEIVLGLRAPPTGLDRAGLDPASGASAAVAALEDAIEWVAHGFEIVQSPWPDWKFIAGQALASQGLHGALFVGPRRRVRQGRGPVRPGPGAVSQRGSRTPGPGPGQRCP